MADGENTRKRLGEARAHPITGAIEALGRGEADAASKLLPLLYTELRRRAHERMRKLPPGQTLQTTALVHEAYLRVAGRKAEGWHGRGHFFAAAARAMRNILVDEARRKAALKRGGERKKRSLEEEPPAIEGPPREDLLALEEILKRLEEDDPRKAAIVNLRFFAGLGVAETAELLGISEKTVKRDWRFARAWLQSELEGGSENE